MTTSIRTRRPAGSTPTLRANGRGLRSVLGKTLRDSRRTTIIVAVVLFVLLISVTAAVATEFATPQSRQQLADLVANLPPILQGLAGKPVNVETMGGYVQYKYGTFFPIVLSLWSILALSSTLAGEARRGSLEFVAATQLTRRRIALEKLSGHVIVILIASLAVFAVDRDRRRRQRQAARRRDPGRGRGGLRDPARADGPCRRRARLRARASSSVAARRSRSPAP